MGWGLSRTYRHVKLASKLSCGCDYALFKVGSAPGTDSRALSLKDSWGVGCGQLQICESREERASRMEPRFS